MLTIQLAVLVLAAYISLIVRLSYGKADAATDGWRAFFLGMGIILSLILAVTVLAQA